MLGEFLDSPQVEGQVTQYVGAYMCLHIPTADTKDHKILYKQGDK